MFSVMRLLICCCHGCVVVRSLMKLNV